MPAGNDAAVLGEIKKYLFVTQVRERFFDVLGNAAVVIGMTDEYGRHARTLDISVALL